MPIDSLLPTGTVDRALDAVGGVAKRAVEVLTSEEKSLLDFTRVGQVTPLVIVDSDVRYQPATKDILHVLATLFTGWYMQALAYEDLLGDVKITERLDRFNPNVNKSFFKAFSFESHTGMGLPPTTQASLEAYNTATPAKAPEVVSKDALNEMTEDRSLAVGKTITLKLHDRLGQPRPVPVTIRLIVMAMDSLSMLAAYSIGSRWNTTAERKHRVNMGELRWLADYWFKFDMIEEHKQALLKDKSGVYANLANRRTDKLLNAIATGDKSLVSASAMCVISAKTAKELERRLGGKLSTYAIRQQLFQQTGLMILVVYDPFAEQTIFYYRDTVDASQLTVNEIKATSKRQDIDVMSLVNTFMAKGAPSF